MAELQRRPVDFKTFDELTADVIRLRENGYDKVGQWSLEQILDHLTRTMAFARDSRNGPPRPVRWLLKPISWQLLRTRRMPTVPAPKKIRPARIIQPGVDERFADEVVLARSIPGDRIDHPAFGWMSVTDWQQIQLIHASRHLSFLIPR